MQKGSIKRLFIKGWSLVGVESLDALFYVTNNAGETIRCLTNNFGQINPFRINSNGKSKKSLYLYLVGVDAAKEQELKSKELTGFSIPVPQNEKPFETVFIFQIGDERREKIIRMMQLYCFPAAV